MKNGKGCQKCTTKEKIARATAEGPCQDAPWRQLCRGRDRGRRGRREVSICWWEREKRQEQEPVSGLPSTLSERPRPGSPFRLRPASFAEGATERGRARLGGGPLSAPPAVLAKQVGGPRRAPIRSITGAWCPWNALCGTACQFPLFSARAGNPTWQSANRHACCRRLRPMLASFEQRVKHDRL